MGSRTLHRALTDLALQEYQNGPRASGRTSWKMSLRWHVHQATMVDARREGADAPGGWTEDFCPRRDHA